MWFPVTDVLLALVPVLVAARGFVRMMQSARLAAAAAEELAGLLKGPDGARAWSRLEAIGGPVQRAIQEILARQRRGSEPGWKELRKAARGLALPWEDGLLLFLMILGLLLLAMRDPAVPFLCVEGPSAAGLLLLRREGARSTRRIAKSFQRLLAAASPRAGS